MLISLMLTTPFTIRKSKLALMTLTERQLHKVPLHWIISLFTSLKWKQISLIKWILTALGSCMSTYRVCTWGILTAMLLYLSSEESKNSNCWNDLNSLRLQGFFLKKEGTIWKGWIGNIFVCQNDMNLNSTRMLKLFTQPDPHCV